MINKKLLFILLGTFFVASICGIIFHFNTKNEYVMFGTTTDAIVSSDGLMDDVDDATAEETPLDRDGVTAADATGTDISTDAVAIENDADMGDALWEDAKKQEDTVFETTDENADGTVEATATDDTVSEEPVAEDNSNSADATSSDTEVIGKFTVNNTGLVVRTGPKGTYDALDTLAVGTTGDIVEVVNDYWVKIKFGDSEAYICSKYAEIEMY